MHGILCGDQSSAIVRTAMPKKTPTRAAARRPPAAKPRQKAKEKKSKTPARSGPAGRWAGAETALRAHALTYPETHEEFPWGERVIKVKKKVFIFMGQPTEGGFGMSVKLPHTAAMALLLPFVQPTGYGLGKSGWVSARFDGADDPPLDMLRAWIDESYRAVAPKTLVARLQPASDPPRRRS